MSEYGEIGRPVDHLVAGDEFVVPDSGSLIVVIGASDPDRGRGLRGLLEVIGFTECEMDVGVSTKSATEIFAYGKMYAAPQEVDAMLQLVESAIEDGNGELICHYFM